MSNQIIEQMINSKKNSNPDAAKRVVETRDAYLSCLIDCIENGNGDLFQHWHDCQELHGFYLEALVDFLGCKDVSDNDYNSEPDQTKT